MSITYFEAVFGDAAPVMVWILHGVAFASTAYFLCRVVIAKEYPIRPLYIRALNLIVSVGFLSNNLPLGANKLPWAWTIFMVSTQSFSIFTFCFMEFNRFLRAWKQALVYEILGELRHQIEADVHEQVRFRTQQPIERHNRE